MTAGIPMPYFLYIDEAQVRLVDKRGRAERLVALPAPTLPVGHDPQLLVQQGDQRAERRAVAALERLEQPRDLVL